MDLFGLESVLRHQGLSPGDREVGGGEENGKNVHLAPMYEDFQGSVAKGGQGVPLKTKKNRACASGLLENSALLN